jgi:cell division protease FtsH
MWNRKMKMFWMNHWVKVLIIFGVITMVSLAIVGLLSLESYYLHMTLAQLPLTLLMGAVHALIFAYVIISMQTGTLLKLKKTPIKSENVEVTFDDVKGIDEAKREALEVVELIKDRTRIKKIGGKIVRGLLMIGPPGCGKTLLAKAIAKESGIPFISMAASEFVEIFVGMGASRVRKLFKKARQLAYGYGACIIFIDEIDAVGRGRSFSFLGGGETNTTQNQLLVEMDGLKEKEENVIVIGATNAPESVLDKALLRPGRFDRKIYIDRPGLEGREELFHHYLRKVKHDPSIDISRLARNTVYKSAADIENIVKEAALIATRKSKENVEWEDLSEAMDRIDMGLKHKRKLSDRERKMTAYHETGHLIVLYILHPTDDVFKASIASRGGALGAVLHQPREELFTTNKEQALANIKVCLGGYVAENLKFRTTTTGVADDFQKAMVHAHAMVWKFGMGSNAYLGDYSIIPESQISNELKEKLNQETQEILQKCYQEVENLLKKEWTIMERFVSELLEKEELEYDEIEAIFAEYGKNNQKGKHEISVAAERSTKPL